jgi:serine/threonine-protein kinase
VKATPERGLDEIWMEVVQLSGESRARRIADLCGGDADRVDAVLRLLAGQPRPMRMPREVPCQLGPYTLLERIADGAHGEVFRATRGDLDGQIALKLLKREAATPHLVETVRKEAGAARRIASEHVIAVHDAGRIEDGPYYIEMALCADPDPARPGAIRLGTSLRNVAASGKGVPTLSPDEAARLIEDLCKGAEAAHRAGVVHGDIKPENVLVTPESRRVMLADFGIATTLATQSAAAGDGLVRVGTLEYMAPEQFEQGRVPDVASDVYMLGGTLLFTLAGEVPHPHRKLAPSGAVDGPRTAVPAGVPRRLAEIVERALAVEPERRFRSAAEMAEQLRRFRELQPTFGDAKHPLRRIGLLCRRHSQVLTALAIALMVSASIALVGYRVLRGTVVAAQRQVDALTSEGGALKAGNADLERRRAELDRDRVRLEAQVANLEVRAQQAQTQLAELPAVRSERDDARGRLAAALARAEEAGRTASAQTEELGRVSGQLSAALEEVERLRMLLDVETERRERGIERATLIQARAAQLEAELRLKDAEAEALGTRAETLAREVAAANARSEVLEQVVEDLRRRLPQPESSARGR